MNQKNGVNKRNIVSLSVIVLTGLLVLDIVCKGQVYKRLPERLQRILSPSIDK